MDVENENPAATEQKPTFESEVKRIDAEGDANFERNQKYLSETFPEEYAAAMAQHAAKKQTSENAIDLADIVKMVSLLFGGTTHTDCEDKKGKKGKVKQLTNLNFSVNLDWE